MKTSILVLALTLLYSLSTFAGTQSQQYDVNKNETVYSYSIIPSPLLAVIKPANIVAGEKKENSVKQVVPMIEDFHYLKFDVARYVEDTEMPDKDNCGDTFDYLKFNVPQSNAYNELTPEILELPVNEFDYLKFDVKSYSDNPDLNSM